MKIKFFEKFKKDIDNYCKNNSLNLSELFTHPLSFNNECLIFYYKVEDTKEFPLVHGEHKLKPLLSIYLRNNKLEFIIDEKIGG